MLSSLATQKDLSTVVVVIAGADEAATLQFLAPYTGATIAEYFMLQVPICSHASNTAFSLVVAILAEFMILAFAGTRTS